MSNYVLKRSDPANGSFIVQSDQIDGTVRPWSAALYVNPVTSLTALSSNSSLVMAGLGITDYGELVQNNLIYLMEHFAYKSRPLTPMQGQIWYKNAAFTDPSYPSDPSTPGLYLWNGTSWGSILYVTSGLLDLSGAKITNVGNATTGTDALNQQTADGRYLQLTGGTVTGPTSFTAGAVGFSGGPVSFNTGVTVSVSDAPTSGNHITNKTYVDAGDASSAGLVSTEASARIAADLSLAGDIATINSQLSDFVQTTGDTMTGTLSFDPDASIFAVMGGTGSFSFGAKRLQQVGEPSINTDATTKYYVDTAITTAIAGLPPTATSDGVVYDGNLDALTGTLTLNRTLGLPDVVITGNFAPFSHGHLATVIDYDMTAPYSQSTVAVNLQATPGYPVVSVYSAVRIIDQQLTDLSRPVHRHVIEGDGSTTTFVLPTDMTFFVDQHKLLVFKDGVKQYANERGYSTVTFTPGVPAIDTLVGITGTYTFTINVDGAGATTVTVTIPAGASFYDLAVLITAALSTAVVPAAFNVEQFTDRFVFRFTSNTTGTGSSVVVSYAALELFTSITSAAAPVNNAVTRTLNYREVGSAGSDSNTVIFQTAPALSTIIEFLLFPG